VTQPTTTVAVPDVARIPRDRVLAGGERAGARRQVVAAYRAGYSLKQIARAAGRGMRLIYTLLGEAGEPLRRGPARRAAPSGSKLRFPAPPPGSADMYVPLEVEGKTVRVDDLVLILGVTRTVRNMRQVGIKGKVLLLDGGDTYWLAWEDTLPARRRAAGRTR
jgi:hypothetical protein